MLACRPGFTELTVRSGSAIQCWCNLRFQLPVHINDNKHLHGLDILNSNILSLLIYVIVMSSRQLDIACKLFNQILFMPNFAPFTSTILYHFH